MLRNQRGIAEVLAIAYVLGTLMILLFVPNPISSSLGMGIRPNKTVQSTVEKVDLIKDDKGNVVATRTTTAVNDRDIQQHVTFWEWLRSLPILLLILMFAGIIFPPIAVFLNNAKNAIIADTKKIVHSVDAGLTTIEDPIKRQAMLDAMSKVQDTSTKKLVSDLKHK